MLPAVQRLVQNGNGNRAKAPLIIKFRQQHCNKNLLIYMDCQWCLLRAVIDIDIKRMMSGCPVAWSAVRFENCSPGQGTYV